MSLHRQFQRLSEANDRLNASHRQGRAGNMADLLRDEAADDDVNAVPRGGTLQQQIGQMITDAHDETLKGLLERAAADAAAATSRSPTSMSRPFPVAWRQWTR